MSLLDICKEMFSNISAGGLVATCVIILSLIEITPIKISPLEIIGNRLNKELKIKIDNLQHRVDNMEKKLDNHIAEEMRRDILDFQNSCLNKRRHTKEEWTYIYKLCDKYSKHIEENGLINSEAEEAIEYLKIVYRECLESGDFIIVSNIKGGKDE